MAGRKNVLDLEQLYLKGLRSLVGVLSKTPTYIVFLETGYSLLRAKIKSRQKGFFDKMINKLGRKTPKWLRTSTRLHGVTISLRKTRLIE